MVVAHRRSRPTPGFTLVELLFVASLVAVLLAGVGSWAVRELRNDASRRAAKVLGEGLSRVRQQLQQEIGQAQRLSTSSADQPPGCILADPLVLIGPGDRWRIAYGLRQQGPDGAWRGPAQLLRCGPAYAASGLIAASPPLQSVMLDRVMAAGGFRSELRSGGAEAALNLLLSSGAGTTIPSRFTARVGGAPTAASGPFAGCAGLCQETDTTNHWRPSGGTIAGDTTKTDILHFPLDRGSYELSDPCDRSICTVSGTPTVIVYNGDVLKFTDQELRLR
jgi:prepilin-type N-terminal cleavage/methylation domain-containing protein